MRIRSIIPQRLRRAAIGGGRGARRVLTVGCLIAVGLAAPAGALAVNVSSDDGNGYQNPSTWYANGATLSGALRSTSGDSVYYSGRVNISLSSDVTVGRYTSNTSSTSYVSRGGDVTAVFTPPSSLQGVRARVCRDVSFAPDPCGSWSSQMSN